MSAETNKTRAIEFMHRFARTATIDRTACSDHATWWTLVSGDLPIGVQDEITRNAAAKMFAGPGRFEIQGVIAEGDKVAIEAQGFQPLVDGRSYDNTYLWLFSFSDGKISRLQAYFDTALAQRTFQPV